MKVITKMTMVAKFCDVGLLPMGDLRSPKRPQVRKLMKKEKKMMRLMTTMTSTTNRSL